MFHQVREFFHGLDSLTVDKEGQPVTEDLQLAAAVLLVDLASFNTKYSPEEGRSILIALEKEFGLPREKSFKLLETAGTQAGRRDKIEEFLQTINDHFDDLQKQRILAMIWRVISADGITEQHETEYASSLRSRLGLTLEQSIRARRMAEGGEDLTIVGKPVEDSPDKPNFES